MGPPTLQGSTLRGPTTSGLTFSGFGPQPLGAPWGAPPFGAHPSGPPLFLGLAPHPLGPHHDTKNIGQKIGLAQIGLAQIGLAKLGLAKIGFGQNWPGQNLDAKNGLAKIGLAKIGQIRIAKTGLAKVGLFPRRPPRVSDLGPSPYSCLHPALSHASFDITVHSDPCFFVPFVIVYFVPNAVFCPVSVFLSQHTISKDVRLYPF